MKKTLLISLFLLVLVCGGNTQTISKANFTISGRFGEIHSAEFVIGDWAFQLDKSGEWLNYNYLPGGEVTFYGTGEGFDRQGKVKSIGGVTIDYYDRFDAEEKLGKVKSVGALKIDYYDRFDDNDMLGKVKAIGDVKFDYYNKFDDTDQLKKLKSIGTIKISYYDKFGDNKLIGFVKSIGAVQMKYFDRFDTTKRRELKAIEGNTWNLYVMAWY